MSDLWSKSGQFGCYVKKFEVSFKLSVLVEAFRHHWRGKGLLPHCRPVGMGVQVLGPPSADTRQGRAPRCCRLGWEFRLPARPVLAVGGGGGVPYYCSHVASTDSKGDGFPAARCRRGSSPETAPMGRGEQPLIAARWAWRSGSPGGSPDSTETGGSRLPIQGESPGPSCGLRCHHPGTGLGGPPCSLARVEFWAPQFALAGRCGGGAVMFAGLRRLLSKRFLSCQAAPLLDFRLKRLSLGLFGGLSLSEPLSCCFSITWSAINEAK